VSEWPQSKSGQFGEKETVLFSGIAGPNNHIFYLNKIN
jgi:hypothetical protein